LKLVLNRRWWIAGVLLLSGLLASLALFLLRQPQTNSVMRGFLLAQQLGCFGCHGAGGTGGVPNPRSEEGEIPAWDGGALLMYVESEEEIAEWILFGKPKRLQGEHHHSETVVEMPAHQAYVNEAELNDLVAYVKAVGSYNMPSPLETAALGLQAATRFGCFGCHRGQGRLGTPNPGSFKGYIPAWSGPDFAELVRDEDELRAWIREGRIQRLQSNPVASFFTNRQVIQMPAYKAVLDAAELDAIVAYIHWLRQTD